MGTKHSLPGADFDNSAAAWEAYDSWLLWANSVANQLYANRALGEISGSMFEAASRIQGLGDAIVCAIYGNLWPALGLSTAGQLSAVCDEIKSVRDEIRTPSRSLRLSHSRAAGSGTASTGKRRNRQIQETYHRERRDEDDNISVDHHAG
jgi:hypothetical protein